MRLYLLNELDWKDTQLVYHALAHLNIEALVLDSPRQPYMCLGLPQNPIDELDMDHCHANGIGIFRREIGGGTVFLNNDQIFYNLILKRDREEVPRIPEAFFRKYLTPVVKALGDLGAPAEYKPLCDLLVGGRKISGNGGGEMGDCMVLAGGLLLDFDFETMSRVMRLGDRMRGLFRDRMLDNLTTVRKETGVFPDKDKIYRALTSRFEELLGPLEPAELTSPILEKMEELDRRYSSDEWFFQRGSISKGREIKVREGVYIFHHGSDVPEGRVELICEARDHIVESVRFPECPAGLGEKCNKMNDLLVDRKYDPRAIMALVNELFGTEGGI